MRFAHESADALCSREESNLHGFPHTVLSRTRLPFRHVSAVSSGLKVARGAGDRKGRLLALEVGPGNYERRLRARVSMAAALRFLPNERSRSA